MAAQTAYRTGVLLVLLATGFFSLSGVLVRLTESAGGWQIILYRSLALAVAMLALLGLAYRGRLVAAIRAAGWPGLMAGIASAAATVFYILALERITVANALFMVGVAPFVAALLGRIFLAEAIPPATWAAMLLGAAGVGVMVEGAIDLDRLSGNMLALGSAIAFAVMTFFFRLGRGVDMVPATLASGALAAGLAVLVIALGQGAAGFAIGGRDLLLCLVMGVVQLGFGMVLYTRGARAVPTAQLQLLATVELILAPLWVWLAVAETPTRATLAGGALILAAVSLQAAAGSRIRRPVPAA